MTGGGILQVSGSGDINRTIGAGCVRDLLRPDDSDTKADHAAYKQFCGPIMYVLYFIFCFNLELTKSIIIVPLIVSFITGFLYLNK